MEKVMMLVEWACDECQVDLAPREEVTAEKAVWFSKPRPMAVRHYCHYCSDFLRRQDEQAASELAHLESEMAWQRRSHMREKYGDDVGGYLAWEAGEV